MAPEPALELPRSVWDALKYPITWTEILYVEENDDDVNDVI